jgi:hypothetical protein
MGFVVVAEYPPADAEHHRPMALDQGPERQLRGLIPAGRELLEQLGVRQFPDLSHAEQRVEILEGDAFPPST